MFLKSVVSRTGVVYLVLLLPFYVITSYFMLQSFEEQSVSNRMHRFNQQTEAIDAATVDSVSDLKRHFTNPDLSFIVIDLNEEPGDDLSTVTHSPSALHFNDQQIIATSVVINDQNVFIIDSMDEFNQSYQHFKMLIIVLGGLFFVSFLIYLVLTSKKISTSIKRLRAHALHLANGQLEGTLPINSQNEMDELNMAMNRMSRQIRNELKMLNQEKEILYRVISSMEDGVMTFNLDFDNLLSNHQANRLLADLLYEEDTSNEKCPERLRELIRPVIDRHQQLTHHLKAQGKDWLITLSPLYENDQLIGVVLLARDITERVQLDQLREAFIANVSHELRTPISLIQGYSEAIIDGVAASFEDQKSSAQIIMEESARMDRLVNELLELAKLKSGQVTLDKQTYQLTSFLDKIKNKFTDAMNRANIVFELEVQSIPEYVTFDYDRLDQVLTNLIDNAMRHTPADGHIRLLIQQDNDQISFKVEDNGTGISKDDLPFVFERFYKADKARTLHKHSKKGTGLGLSIAKQIIQAHNGTIAVQSTEGEGTTFTFTLPIE
ncbi:two-component system, OmpR family, sensor histidine kinase ResE [Pelagirhabdus alkalitolerans]|uniref:histidine kinase n=1 Tax=Pelagirhabdus alkalitolerans TaxID=1612202 RepID=A0A1G6HCD6_9BACI|nr:ATP-binding protein [Pelagirhabdus alkalitolerans]SDB91605.1 two-component system, OmpR family, sensor histidine kinase ResE [Pelagirhabdus alkalitolerans]